jgi:hypothetical protein
MCPSRSNSPSSPHSPTSPTSTPTCVRSLLFDFLAANTLIGGRHCTLHGTSPTPQPRGHFFRPSSSVVIEHGTHGSKPSTMPATSPTSRIDLFLNRLAEGKLLWELLPVTARPSWNREHHAAPLQIHDGIPFDRHRVQPEPAGMITVRGHPTQLFAGKPVNLRPLNLGAVREFVLSSRTRPLASMWSRFRQAIQEMSGLWKRSSLAVGSRYTICPRS